MLWHDFFQKHLQNSKIILIAILMFCNVHLRVNCKINNTLFRIYLK